MSSTGPKPKVLHLGSIDHAQAAWSALGELAELVESTATNRTEFIQECKDGKLDGVVAIYRTIGSITQTGLVDEELLNVLPSSLRYIAHCGSGYDQIDVHACSARNPPVRVSNVPTAVDDATADVNMFLILGALRNFNAGMNALREGKWRGNPAPPLGHDPEGKVLGILGMGGIGRNLKKKAEAFGMKVIYHNRRELSDEMSAGAQYVSFDELLSTSDVVSLNLPLNKNTRHIIGKAEFAKMKDGVVVVNTARGAVMDEAALVDALDSGKVFSAGLDVFEEEPKIHPGLLSNQNVILVPHMGTWTIETIRAMEEWTIGNIRMALEVGKLKSPVPEQADL
ncbi:D-isomer specific 2-hydroxyacid dehydrogenase NAD-binding [Penicillium coprophilum]|uniref:D-isomer specific 2-hydroxyacid dehydrogenase NAD-binding n=1 Tax=Penicillium coprophilum TaxID=36646 RepID=UPI0023A5AECB|nr:D-isomer specific 2-hydroxyacid dehydrogenase NAD-binding [Penicillium coprophilum]KAJ5169576.1 D-isomer specific 2-hydroxyacid dehydrogenase NAD-binding [Penicillium coprophilum]